MENSNNHRATRKPRIRKAQKPKRPLTYFDDPDDDTPLVRVPLAGEGGIALVNRTDLEWLTSELGLSANWTLNMGQVRAPLKSAKGHLIGVARTIMGAGPKQCVSYANRDRTDLRRKNLSIRKESGNRAKRNDAALLRQDARARGERTKVKPDRVAA